VGEKKPPLTATLKAHIALSDSTKGRSGQIKDDETNRRGVVNTGHLPNQGCSAREVCLRK